MKFIHDNFDKLLMLFVTMTFLVCWLIYQLPELARLTELAFVGLTALVGGRRSQPTNSTDSGDINVAPENLETTEKK